MNYRLLSSALLLMSFVLCSSAAAVITHAEVERAEMRAHQPITINIYGPELSETGDQNPFLDYRCDVILSDFNTKITVPAYFAGEANTADSGAESGKLWRAHFVPPRAGPWTYEVRLLHGKDVAIADKPEGESENGAKNEKETYSAEFAVDEVDPSQPQQRIGKILAPGDGYLRYAGSGEVFIKGGADSPENFLAYVDFDNTHKNPAAGKKKRSQPIHRYEPHLKDWKQGDPTWKGGKGKALIGALNYLASKGMNSVYFLTMNVTGDGDDVWPWLTATERTRFDLSKLDQWNRVFDHIDKLGLSLHVLLQETENDKLLDGGDLGLERKLYYREMVARFGHHQGLVWNLGEETTLSSEQLAASAAFIRSIDPHGNPIVVHSYPDQQEKVFAPLLGKGVIDGTSLQFSNNWQAMPGVVADWKKRSANTGKKWFVNIDEPGNAQRGVDHDSRDPNNQTLARKYALWGNLMSGGSGVEWYFGYANPHTDLNCEDWRSREQLWTITNHALTFFREHCDLGAAEQSHELLADAEGYCLTTRSNASNSKVGSGYVLYLLQATSKDQQPKLNLADVTGQFEVQWYDPLTGGDLQQGSVQSVAGGEVVPLGLPPGNAEQDWALLITPASK